MTTVQDDGRVAGFVRAADNPTIKPRNVTVKVRPSNALMSAFKR
jgi:hypothetical protein